MCGSLCMGLISVTEYNMMQNRVKNVLFDTGFGLTELKGVGSWALVKVCTVLSAILVYFDFLFLISVGRRGWVLSNWPTSPATCYVAC